MLNFVLLVGMAMTAQTPGGLKAESFDLFGSSPLVVAPPVVTPKKEPSLFTTGPTPPVLAVSVPAYTKSVPVQAVPQQKYRVVRRFYVNQPLQVLQAMPVQYADPNCGVSGVP